MSLTRRGFFSLLGAAVVAPVVNKVAPLAPLLERLFPPVVAEPVINTPIVFPLIRRVYPMYWMEGMVALQPLERQGGKIFYLDTLAADDIQGGIEGMKKSLADEN